MKQSLRSSFEAAQKVGHITQATKSFKDALSSWLFGIWHDVDKVAVKRTGFSSSKRAWPHV